MSETVRDHAKIDGGRASRQRLGSQLGYYVAGGLRRLRLAAGQLPEIWDDPMSSRFNQQRERDQQMLRRRGSRY